MSDGTSLAILSGDKALGVAYWTHMTNDKTGYGTVDFFGHDEDKIYKVNGCLHGECHYLCKQWWLLCHPLRTTGFRHDLLAHPDKSEYREYC